MVAIGLIVGVLYCLLTNRVPAATRRKVLARLAAGEVDVVIGTHALIQEDVAFRSLGVAVIVFTIIITWVYIRRANSEFDSLTDQIVKGVVK